MAVPVTLDDQSVDSFIQSNRLVGVTCYADWCTMCPPFCRTVDDLAEEFDGSVSFGKLDKDTNPQFVQRRAILKVPTLLLFQDGRLVERWMGILPIERCRSQLSHRLSSL